MQIRLTPPSRKYIICTFIPCNNHKGCNLFMKIYRLLFPVFFVLLLAAHVPVRAQNASIKGFVYEKESGEPVIFTNVYLYRTNYGATTDVNGFFAITQVPPGNYTLMVTYIGYDTLRMEVSLAKGQQMSQKLFLSKGSIEIKGVNVVAESQESRNEVRTSVITVTPKKITQIPTVGGVPDLAQYLQVTRAGNYTSAGAHRYKTRCCWTE
jgi:hypothetical protein